jgi:hypothetical protein
LGKAFLAGVEAATAEIVRHPLMWRRIKGRFRRYLIPRFPYGLMYAVQGSDHCMMGEKFLMKLTIDQEADALHFRLVDVPFSDRKT